MSGCLLERRLPVERAFGWVGVYALSCFALTTFVAVAPAQTLPDGPGKETLLKLCSTCHEPARAVTRHQSRDGWQVEITKMKGLGAKGTDDEFARVLDYLAKNFPPAEFLVNINTATEVELEVALQITHQEARAILRYKDTNGEYQSVDDLKKVPGVDGKKIDANKDRVSI